MVCYGWGLLPDSGEEMTPSTIIITTLVVEAVIVLLFFWGW